MVLSETARYDRERVSPVGEHAVVLGGSIAGLCAARVLADAYDSVTVVERDVLPDEPVVRDGAPQTRQPHILLEAGRATVEDLFPGFCETVLARGGLLVDAARDLSMYREGGFVAAAETRLSLYCATRPLFEQVARERVRALDDVTVRDGTQWLDYRTNAAGDAVTGVDVQTPDGEHETLAADLVMDATGRTSRTPSWLEERGDEAPAVETVSVDVSYATIRVERPPDDRRVLFASPGAPRTRGGVAIPVEGGAWVVTLQGMHGDEAPTDPEAFVAFAESLPVPELGRIVREHEWRTNEAVGYPFPSSRRYHYEDLDALPDGLLVTGDALASFNPVYGHGMSVAALDALHLHHALAAGTDALAPRFFERAADTVDVVWRLAVGPDFEYAQTTGPKPLGTDVFNRYIARLTRKAHDDPVLAETLARVFLLEESPATLFAPRTLWRALRPGVSR
ncbi:NAD(P)/FAD-dependent oxidoreductase [Halarchaeum sp. P4]|uniref:NAD(P)/FAD-dependent oxidoreductase n=1 Tax=Halarchaeum sp. P4 TaxID=3421639 RepID=UPI003EC00E66